MTPFTHLHVASGYSLRYGASMPNALVEAAVAQDMDALALTDRDGLYGAVKFATACEAAGISPLLGVDLAVEPEPGVRVARVAPPAPRRTPVRGGSSVDPRLPRVTVLALGPDDEAGRRAGLGWGALCRLVSAVHRRGERGTPVATRELLARYAAAPVSAPEAGGLLVVLLGPDSEVGRAVLARRPDRARELLERWRQVLPAGSLAVELVHHRAPQGRPGSLGLAVRMLALARAAGVPVVITNAVRHVEESGAMTADVLDAARRLVALDPRHLDRVTSEGFLAPAGHMAARAREIADASGDASEQARLLADTAALAACCRLDPGADLGVGHPSLPEPHTLDLLPEDVGGELLARCRAGIERCYPGAGAAELRTVHRRLKEELATIHFLKFPMYFLTVAQVCDLVRGLGARVAARGSGAGCLVNHLLGISGIDPIRYDLVMERFLSRRRFELPDIDVDVEAARRPEIYEAILDRFGGERVACVSMMDTYRVRHAVRDAGAALGMPPAEIDAIAKAFPHIRARDARHAIAELPELRASGLGERHLNLLFDLVEQLDGLPRHVALHPCGVLLSDATLLDRTPVEESWAGFPMSQFDKDDVEAMGLLKLDVLGIRMQSSMAFAVAEVARVDGSDAARAGGYDPTEPYVDADGRIDLDAVPHDDEATFRLIRSTHTLGCFQIESPGQRELVGKFAPESFLDLIIDISLFRPGPVKSDMIVPFLRARQGWDSPQYLHPVLEPVLGETHGVVVFHEQVLRMITTTTGCDLDEADEVRRSMGTSGGQSEVWRWYRHASLAAGFDVGTVDRVWEVLKAFASFGFCKAHAAAFALPTYQSAWLKAHHPAAFLAGILTHDPGMYPKRLMLQEARSLGISVLPLEVNLSDDVYRVERLAEPPDPQRRGARRLHPDLPDGSAYGIRLCLADVKGIDDGEIGRIVAGRPYRSLADFWHRAGVSRPVVERLVVAGAFDALYGLGEGPAVRRRDLVNRRDLLLQVAELDRWSRSAPPAGPRTRQMSLDLGDAPDETVRSGLPEMDGAERVRAELDVLGLDVSRHVIDFYAPLIEALGVTRSHDVLSRRSRSELLVAGVKVATQTPPVRSGRRVVFLTLDDATGPVDATFFEDVQGPYAATVFGSWLLLIRGVLRRTGPRGVSLRATGAWELPALWELWTGDGIDAVHELLAASPVPGELVPGPGSAPDGGIGTPAGRRVLVHATGYQQSPYADIKPAGDDTRNPPRKLWHSSPGSSGR